MTGAKIEPSPERLLFWFTNCIIFMFAVYSSSREKSAQALGDTIACRPAIIRYQILLDEARLTRSNLRERKANLIETGYLIVTIREKQI